LNINEACEVLSTEEIRITKNQQLAIDIILEAAQQVDDLRKSCEAIQIANKIYEVQYQELKKENADLRKLCGGLVGALRNLHATYSKGSDMYCRAFEFDAEKALLSAEKAGIK